MERRRTLAISLALAGHVVAVGALVVSGAWKIDKLSAAEPPMLSPLLPAASAPMPAGGEEAHKPETPKREHRVHDRTQRAAAATTQEAASDDAGGADGDGAAGTGDGPGGDGAGVIPFACPPGAPCQALSEEVALAAPPPRRVVLPARLVEGRRIAGDPQIQPPDVVRTHMLRGGQDEARGTVEMCLDRAGRVSSLRMLLSTRHPAYDARLLERMRTWRYRPYRMADGDAVPICTAVTFIYRVR
ncbi:MAG TPA: hypothetical protein VMZ28_00775 [Kofleriaceae bacterium]|nr:hypothetical protein [Kofleriaceae bacterium]